MDSHTDMPEFEAAEKEVNEKNEKLISINGKQSVDDFHKRLGKVMWEHCGMARNKEGLKLFSKKYQLSAKNSGRMFLLLVLKKTSMSHLRKLVA